MLMATLLALTINVLAFIRWRTGRQRISNYDACLSATYVCGTMNVAFRLFAPSSWALMCILFIAIQIAAAVGLAALATRNWHSFMVNTTLSCSAVSLSVSLVTTGLYGAPVGPWSLADALCLWSNMIVSAVWLQTYREHSCIAPSRRVSSLITGLLYTATYCSAVFGQRSEDLPTALAILGTLYLAVASNQLHHDKRCFSPPPPVPWRFAQPGAPFTLAVGLSVVVSSAAVLTLDPPATAFSAIMILTCLASLMLRTHATMFEYHRAAARVRRDRRNFAAIIEGSTDAIGLCDLRTHQVTYVSPSSADVIGVKPFSLVGTHLTTALKAQGVQLPTVHPKSSCSEAMEISSHNATFELVLTPHGKSWLFRVRDVSKDAEKRRRLRWLAYHDELTGIRNRAAITRYLRELIDSAETQALIAFIDLGDLKSLNRTYGYDFGDRVLQRVAARLSNVAPGHTVCGRLGGDEFVVIDTRPINADALTESLVETLSEPYPIDGVIASVPAAIGLARLGGFSTPGEAIAAADMAMYAAKKEQSDRVSVLSAGGLAGGLHSASAVSARSDLTGWFANPARLVNGGHEIQILPRGSHEECSTCWRMPAPELLDSLAFDAVRYSPQSGIDEEVRTIVLPISVGDCVNDRMLDALTRFAERKQGAGISVRVEFKPCPELHATEVMRQRVIHLMSREIDVGIDGLGSGYAFFTPVTSLPVTCVRTAPWLMQRTDVLVSLIRTLMSCDLNVAVSGVDTEAQALYTSSLGIFSYSGRHAGEPTPILDPAAPYPHAVQRVAPEMQLAESVSGIHGNTRVLPHPTTS